MEKSASIARILAVETSGAAFSAAASSGGDQLHGEVFLNIGLRHSEILARVSAELLERCGWGKGDLTHLAVSIGPGSFTGLRVGISFTRALAQALRIPLIGVSTFEILAAGFRQLRPDPLCVCIESIGTEVFAAFYPAKQPIPKESGVYPLEEVLARARRGGFQAIGDGVLRHPQLAETGEKIPAEFHFPRASHLARLAAQRIRSKKPRSDSWKSVVPLYLRPPVAVERLNYRKKKDRIGKTDV